MFFGQKKLFKIGLKVLFSAVLAKKGFVELFSVFRSFLNTNAADCSSLIFYAFV